MRSHSGKTPEREMARREEEEFLRELTDWLLTADSTPSEEGTTLAEATRQSLKAGNTSFAAIAKTRGDKQPLNARAMQPLLRRLAGKRGVEIAEGMKYQDFINALTAKYWESRTRSMSF